MKKSKALCVLLAVLVILPCLGLGGCGKTYEVQLEYNYHDIGESLSKGLDIKVKKGKTIPREYLNPYRRGYLFKGWYRDPSFNSIWLSTDKVESDVILYAKWERDN